MSKQRSRFLHLESARRPTGEPGERPRLEGSDRFAAPVAPGEVQAAQERVAEAHVARFRQEAPLAAELAFPEAMPFRRCARCEVDNSLYVSVCSRCDADLTTPAQRAFNAQLWETRQREEAQERAELEALARARQTPALDPRELERMLEQLRREERAWAWRGLVRWLEGARAGGAARRHPVSPWLAGAVFGCAVLGVCVVAWRSPGGGGWSGIGRLLVFGALVLAAHLWSRRPR